jgi:type I restriction enzyme S subunit
MSNATTHIEIEKRSAERSRSKLAPALRFKEFDGEWCKDKIGNITNVTSGGTPSTLKPEYWGGDIRWMNSGDLNLKRVFEVKNRITEKGLEKSSTKIIPVNSILIGLAGQGKTRGTAAMNIVELCINQSIAAILPAENFDSEFLYQNIDGRYEELRRLSTGDGGRGGLNLQIIKGFYVPVPTLPEQQKIASFLSAVDEKIQQLTKKKELLEQYKKGVMQQLFPSTGSGQRSGQLRFKPARPAGGDENGNPYPDWEEKRLGEIATKSSSNISANTIEENEGKYKIYGASGLLKKIDFFREKEPFISIVKDGAGVGRTLLCDANSSVLGTLDIIKPKVKVVLYFLYSVLNNVRFEKYMVGTTIPHIYFKDYSSERITIPCYEEQQKIAIYLSGIDAKIAAVNTQITQTQTFKKGLLQQMFV